MQIEEMSVWPGWGAAQRGVVAQNNQAAATHYTIHWAAARRQFPAPDPSTWTLDLETKVHENFTITEKAPTSTFTMKSQLRQYV